MRSKTHLSLACIVTLALAVAPADAQDVCPDDFCDNQIDSLCDPGGFQITFLGFDPANTSNDGVATYAYEICNPPAGVCTGGLGLRAGESCLDNGFCREKGQDLDPNATCSRDCAVDTFRGLSHFDVFFPDLGAGSCLGEGIEITGTCACSDGSSEGCSVDGDVVLGDGSCPQAGPSAPVAKCDGTELPEGDCIVMTLQIPGENNLPGAGSTVVLSKESRDCNESCILGPSCDPCFTPQFGSECLTRTRGFWSTHPHLIQGADSRSMELLPVTVCDTEITTTEAGSCGSTSQALCTSGRDCHRNPTFLSLAAQLTAARLNLAATGWLVADADCGSWVYDDGDDTVDSPFEGDGIAAIIDTCEAGYCDARKQDISSSGCIEALTAFNESEDTGFDQTPVPFDRPGPAQVDECQLARGDGNALPGGRNGSECGCE